MIPLDEQLKKLLSSKLENYVVITNDSNFNDVKQIIGDNYKDGQAYLITNNPINDKNFIQGGARHTVLGMEYDNQNYGYQISFSFVGILYRYKDQGIWGSWTSLIQNITTGVEFKTGRIIDNKEEYGKRIYIDSFPATNGEKEVPTGLSNVSYTRPIEGIATNGTYWFPINGVRPIDGTDNSCIGAYIGYNNIILTSNSDRSDFRGNITVYYTKN